jgi:hypothetical protein
VTQKIDAFASRLSDVAESWWSRKRKRDPKNRRAELHRDLAQHAANQRDEVLKKMLEKKRAFAGDLRDFPGLDGSLVWHF